jgi:hypothetical protein
MKSLYIPGDPPAWFKPHVPTEAEKGAARWKADLYDG